MDSLPLMENMADVLARTSLASEGEMVRKMVSAKPKDHQTNDDNNNNNNSVMKGLQPTVAVSRENREVLAKLSPLQEFYKGTNIFITGGTGFMGKILLEKLFRACPELDTIYLLVRVKRGKDVHTRLDEIFEDPVFDSMKKLTPKFQHKIVVVPGDVSMAGLGLSLPDRQVLIDKVDVVFHAAATVRFDEKLSLALSINVEGVKGTIELCKCMKKLKSVIHVSTAYSNCFRPGSVDECFYQYPIKYEDVCQQVAKMDDAALEKNTNDILGPWPNTYTFTKALAEDYLRQNCKGLPIGMFRPAIVTATFKEPEVGWIDNLYGPTGVIAGAGTGLLRTLHCDEKLHANVVPVDYCVNALLASAWEVANNCNERKEENMLIYNYVSNVENPLTWKRFCYLNRTYGFEYPFATAIWYYCLTLNKSAFWDKVYTYAYHYTPAVLIDGLSMCVGQKPRLLKMYRKIHKFSDVISYFCTHDWNFTNDNVQHLWEKMTAEDKKLFPFSMKNMDWVHYFKYYIKGMRTFLFKEQFTQEESVQRWRRFYILHMLLKMTGIVTISYAVWTIFYRLFFKPM